MSDTPKIPMYHDDPDRFRAALTYTSARTGFLAALIEKDYYCSLLLNDFGELMQIGLVFKGGTCLSKVHTEFFRLSEDLDFTISVSTDSTRSDRRKKIKALEGHLQAIPTRQNCFREATPFTVHDVYRQYNGRLAYRSILTGEDEFIKVELSVREPILMPPEVLPARTLLIDPSTEDAALPPMSVTTLSIQEAYAEKTRAALTRKEPAIRDFFDIDNAVLKGLLLHQDAATINLISQKLSATDDPIDISSARFAAVHAQVETQLKSVVRIEDFKKFDLERVAKILQEVVESCSKK